LLCSGNSTYTLNIIPPGATISWLLSNNTVASISGSAIGNSVTLSKGTGNGNTILSAYINDCTRSYGPVSLTITVGVHGDASLQANPPAFDFCNTSLLQFDASLQNPSPGTSLQWSTVGSGASVKFSATGYTPVLNVRRSGSFTILGTISNACGSSNYNSGVFSSTDLYNIYCGSPFRVSVSPNPVKNFINVNLYNDFTNTLFVTPNNDGQPYVAFNEVIAAVEAGDTHFTGTSAKAQSRTNTRVSGAFTSTHEMHVYSSNISPTTIIKNEKLILMRTKAKTKENTPASLGEAVTAINRVSTVYAGTAAKAELINEILKQRRFSLFWVGHRWFDMRRRNLLPQITPLGAIGSQTFVVFENMSRPDAEVQWDKANPQ
jgi:hypothetical protein